MEQDIQSRNAAIFDIYDNSGWTIRMIANAFGISEKRVNDILISKGLRTEWSEPKF